LPEPAVTPRRPRRLGPARATRAARHAAAGASKKPLRSTHTSETERARVPDQFDQAAMAEWVRQNREDQGLPATIRDPETLDKFAALVAEGVVRSRREAQTRQSSSRSRRPSKR
jgi:hypothetical protein